MSPSVMYMVHSGRAQRFEDQRVGTLRLTRDIHDKEVGQPLLRGLVAGQTEISMGKRGDVDAAGIMLYAVRGRAAETATGSIRLLHTPRSDPPIQQCADEGSDDAWCN